MGRKVTLATVGHRIDVDRAVAEWPSVAPSWRARVEQMTVVERDKVAPVLVDTVLPALQARLHIAQRELLALNERRHRVEAEVADLAHQVTDLLALTLDTV